MDECHVLMPIARERKTRRKTSRQDGKVSASAHKKKSKNAPQSDDSSAKSQYWPHNAAISKQ
jgi:hypothetical protein